MRLEDKLVDGRDAAHDELMQREDTLAHGEDKLPEPTTDAVIDAGLELRGRLLGAVRLILDGQTVKVRELRLPQAETRGLEALQVATYGRSQLGEFVYATDRRDLLERALAVLQPNLTRADDRTALELHAQFADLAQRVAELRGQLTELEDAQDEVLEPQQKAALEAAAAEAGDKPKPKPKPTPSDPDAPRPATTLTGPERPEPPRPATTLTGSGPEPPPPDRTPATTLTGPERPEPPRPASTAFDPGAPELPPEPARTSTLVESGGPELPAEASTATSLGDPEEIASPKRPWWRRPFG